MKEISIVIHAFIESFLSHTFLTVIKASKGQSNNQTQNQESDGILKDFSLAPGVNPVFLVVEKINKEIVANAECTNMH